jgi:hypothetical protein
MVAILSGLNDDNDQKSRPTWPSSMQIPLH